MIRRLGIRAGLRRLGLYPGISERTEPVSRLSNLAWWPASIGCDRGPIARTGVAMGKLGPAWSARFLREMETAPVTSLVPEHRWGYFSENRPRDLEHLNRVNEYRTVRPSLLAALRDFLAEKRAEFDACLGHSWRVASLRAFYLRAGGVAGGRHFDGWPVAIRKVFILPNGATPRTGTTWFRLRDGCELLVDHPEPLWMIFENSQAQHQLVPGAEPRPTIELNLVPARQTSIEPNFVGLNCWYPFYPWVGASGLTAR
jgi:hypothetical protein